MRAPLKFELDRRQGVINIGYGAGSSPSFASLTVTGVITVGGSVHGANGTAADPSFAFSSNQNTGLYRIGANNIGVAANGAKVLDISTTGLTVVGAVNVADGTAAAPSISFASDTDTGFYRNASGQMGFSANGALSLWFATGGRLYGASVEGYTEMPSGGGVNLVAAGSNKNITLTPSGTGSVDVTGGTASTVFTLNSTSASGTYALVKSAGATKFWAGYNPAINAYTVLDSAGTTNLFSVLSTGRVLLSTGSTDSGALLQIGTNTTTSAGGIVFGTDLFLYRNGSNLYLDQSGTTSQYIVSISGVAKAAFGVSSGSTYLDGIGSLILRSNGTTTALTLDASQNATFAGSVTAAAAANFTFSGRSYISSPSDGIIRLLNNAGTDFTRLQFGGTSASFPSIKRTGAQFDLLLADESDFTTVRLANVRAVRAAATASAGEVAYGGTTATTVGAAGGASALPLTPTGYIIVNVAGTQMKVPYYAN